LSGAKLDIFLANFSFLYTIPFSDSSHPSQLFPFHLLTLREPRPSWPIFRDIHHQGLPLIMVVIAAHRIYHKKGLSSSTSCLISGFSVRPHRRWI